MIKNFPFFYCLLWLFFACNSLSAQSVVLLDHLETAYDLGGENTLVLQDETSNLTIENILQPAYQAQFQKRTEKTFHFGTNNHAYWIKFKIQNLHQATFILECVEAYKSHIDLYTLTDENLGTYTIQKAGAAVNWKDKKLPHYYAAFYLDSKAQPTTYYLRLVNNGVISPLKIQTHASFTDFYQLKNLFLGIFIGLFCFSLVYNLYAAYLSKQKIYLIYSFLATTYVLFSLYFEGYMGWILKGFEWNNQHYQYVGGSVMYGTLSISLLVYGLTFFKVPTNSYFFRIAALLIICYLCYFFIPPYWGALFGQLLGGCTLVYAVCLGVSGVRKKIAGAFYYLLAYIVLLSFSLLEDMRVTFGFPYYFPLSYLTLGFLSEMLTLAYGLSYHMNNHKLKLEQDNLRITAENLQLIEEQKERLEELVNLRTAELQKQTFELEQANETKNKLFAIIGHDLRSPIANLGSILDMVRENQVTQEEFFMLLPKLHDRVKNLRYTLENLLEWSYSQLEGLQTKPTSVYLPQLIEEKVNFLADLAQMKAISFETSIQAELTIWADENHLRLILRNLLNNAIKFTNPNGIVTIKGYDSPLQKDFAEIAIQDTGVGMSASKLKTLFHPNQSVSTYGTAGEKGTGLGLLLCKETVEKNGGQIWVTSEEGKGSTFYFTMPKN